MGNTYVVLIYKFDKTYEGGAYRYVEVWRGESRKEALKIMDKYGKERIGCIKLEYRP